MTHEVYITLTDRRKIVEVSDLKEAIAYMLSFIEHPKFVRGMVTDLDTDEVVSVYELFPNL